MNEKLLNQIRRENPFVHTIRAYIGALHTGYEIKRSHLKGREYL